MPFIEWGPQYRVEVDDIDRQHRQLVDMLNELYDAMVARRAAEGVRSALEQMQAYARDHFELEERYMTLMEYPELAEHCAQHGRFIRKTKELDQRVATGKLVLSLEVISYLRDWLTNHILGTDKRLGRFLNKRGVR